MAGRSRHPPPRRSPRRLARPHHAPASFAVLLRYQTTNERAYYRAQKSLEDWQLGRREFVSQEEAKDAKAKQAELFAFLTKPFPEPRSPEYYDKLRASREVQQPAAVPTP